MESIVISAVMRDGTRIRETARDFGEFVAIVLPLRRDPECVRLCWAVLLGDPTPIAANAA